MSTTQSVVHADCLEWLRQQPEGSFTAIVTDPPYHLTAKSRGGSPRTNNPETPFGRPRLADRGFVGQTWDGGAVALRPETWAQCLRVLRPGGRALIFGGTRTYHRLACAVEDGGFEIHDCLMWLYGQGFPKAKSSLKPAWEPILLARRPAGRVRALNLDECRVGGPAGRWPANLILDEEAGAMLDVQAPDKGQVAPLRKRSTDKLRRRVFGVFQGSEDAAFDPHDAPGGASRFFYCAKASKEDRGEGNTHPTVKPVGLMRWLVRLVKDSGANLVLDPFAGSGTTGVACARESVPSVLIEREAQYVEIIRRRMERARP